VRPAARALVVTVVAVAALGATAGGAAAKHTSIKDRNDTNAALDVRRVEMRHPARNTAVWGIETWGVWKASRIWDRGYFFVYLDTRWGERAEHYVLIRSTGSGVQALLFREHPGGNDTLMRSLRVWRWNQRRVAFKLKLTGLAWGPSRTFYRWSVITTFTSEICPNVCLDAAPDSGSVTQERG
jgi:hypothetical protein